MKNQLKYLGTDPESGLVKLNLFPRPFFVIWLVFALIQISGEKSEIPLNSPANLPPALHSGASYSGALAGFGNIGFAQLDFIPAKSRDGKTGSRPLFGENPGMGSIIWSAIWQIPWNAQFGRFLEWTPFLFSLGWLVIWHFIMLTIHYLRSIKQQAANSMFYEFTKFVQIIYVFCCTQALL